jgi:hypothetical protein
MENRAMARKLMAKRAIDVSNMPRVGNYYILDKVEDGIDYCNAKEERWIWSIGRRLADDVILASHFPDLYQNPKYECLWLR